MPPIPCLPSLPQPLAVACHDAGAANVILPWLDDPSLQLRAVMRGPALRLWQQRFGERPLCDTPRQALQGAAFALTGTGWASSLEHETRVLARQRGVLSAAVLDHWVNYAMRFERDEVVCWPDAFWVTDDDAAALAVRTFPGATVRQFDNLYLAEQVRLVGPTPADGDVLVVMEPMRNDWGRATAGEWQALEHFVQQRAAAGIAHDAPVRLRPHPSDAPGRYAAWLAAHPGVQLADSGPLAQALAGARWVVGCESYALVVALAAGREVWSSLPPWAPACRLPQAGLRHLRSLGRSSLQAAR